MIFITPQVLLIYTEWNDKIVALEKTTWLHFRLMKTGFLFCCRPSTSWPVVYEPSIISESDTMFNERDRRWAALQFMLSTDPSYDNRAIASTLKMQIQTVQRAQGDESKVSSYGYGLWCGFKWGPHHATSHLWSWLESQHQSIPGCAEECGGVLVQSGGRWQTLGVAAGLGAGPQVQRDPGLASEGVLQLCTLLSLLPPPSRPEPAGLLRLVIHQEHHQHDLPQHQSQPDRHHSLSSRCHLWKRHAPSSWSVSRRWLRPKAATLNRCQLYYIIKLTELIFSIKVLK